jgi:hypothetical protein
VLESLPGGIDQKTKTIHPLNLHNFLNTFSAVFVGNEAVSARFFQSPVSDNYEKERQWSPQ